jgi:serine/threonine protein kinase
MNIDTDGPADSCGRHDDLLADCLDAVAASPRFAAELRELLDGRDYLARLAPPSPYRGDDPDATVLHSGAFGKYELCGVLGRGGMGVVYRALETDTGRTFALKVIRDGRFAPTDHMRRFQNEHLIASHLSHPNIVPVFEVGEQDGQPFFTMPLVEGGSLAKRIAEAPFPSQKAAHLLTKVARAVHYGHEKGAIHRDLKPANVLLDEQEEPHVVDFGLAKILTDSSLVDVLEASQSLTSTGAILGTYGYMAPEQARGLAKEAGPATDVYGLGAVLYATLTGRPPFQAETPLKTLHQVIDTPPAPPQFLNPTIDIDLQTICLKCLSKNPADRYPSARELADDLDRYLAHQPIRARRPNLWDHLAPLWEDANISKKGRRIWSNILLGSAFLILAMHLSLFFLFRAGAPLVVLWLTAALWEVPVVALLWIFLVRRRRPLGPKDRTPLVMWIGYAVSSLLLLPLARPWEEFGAPSALLSWYPPLAVLTGIFFVIDASLHWGRMYLIGLGFLALAVPLWLLPAWSPLIFGLFATGCLIQHGLAYRRSAR